MGIFGKQESRIDQRTPVRPFESNKPYQQVVGESNYFAAIQALYPTGGSGEIAVDVSLIHDPRNRYDKNAVEVRAATGLLGFLPREDAITYAPILAQLQANGAYLVTDARVYGWVDEDWDSGKPIFKGSVSVTLPVPHLLFPINGEPERPYLLLPYGNVIQVTGEGKHADALKPYLRKAGEAWVYATLQAFSDESGRTPKTVVQVQIDGNPVGVLSKASGEHLLPVISYLAAKNVTPVVRALVRGNALKTDVVLQVKKAGELDMEWLGAAALDPAYEQTVTIDTGEGPGPSVDAAQEPATAVQTPSSGVAESQPPPPTELPPANWYPDPEGERRLRYWDGQRWTDHVADQLRSSASPSNNTWRTPADPWTGWRFAGTAGGRSNIRTAAGRLALRGNVRFDPHGASRRKAKEADVKS